MSRGNLPSARRIAVVVRLARRRAAALWASLGSSVSCPICDWSGRAFLSVGGVPNRLCPRCGSLQRYRMLLLFLQRQTNVFTTPQVVLEVAPSGPVVPVLRAAPTVSYLGLDLNPRSGISVRGDITALPIAAGAVDTVVCFHVLEHIADDGAAMRELNRVIAASGVIVLQVPLRGRETEEDADATPLERARRFGQEDHVRYYGWDIVDRLQEAGFDVEVKNPSQYLAPQEVTRYALHGDDWWILTCRRTAQPQQWRSEG